MLVKLRRMEADLLATRALVHASLTPDSKVDPIIKAFQEYADKVLPFLSGAQDIDKQKEREALFKFTKVQARINTKSIYKEQAAKLARTRKTPEQFKLRPRMPGL